jgi:predicted aspartyl protease
MRIAVPAVWLAIVLGARAAAPPDYRLFTDRQGRTTVARIVRGDEHRVTLVDLADREFTIDRGRFLPDDQAYISRWIRQNKDPGRPAPLVAFLELQGYRPVRFRVGSNGHVMIPVRVDRKVMRFLLDTGVARTALDTGAARFLGLSLSDGRGEVSALADSVKARKATVTEIDLGGQAVRNVRVIVFDLNRHRVQMDQHQKPVDGLLGADLLKRFDAVVDYRNQVLHVRDAGTPADPVSLHTFLTRRRYEHADFEVNDSGHLGLPVDVNGERLSFVLDTGATRSVLDAGVVERLSLPVTEAKARAYGIGVEEAALQIARLESLEVGPIALGLRNLFSIDLNPGTGVDRPVIHGLIGGEVMTLFSGVIDYRNRRLYLKTRGGVEGS